MSTVCEGRLHGECLGKLHSTVLTSVIYFRHFPVQSMWENQTFVSICIHLQMMYNVHPCSINVPSMFHQCSINVPSMFHQCSINVPSMFHQCSTVMFDHIVLLLYSFWRVSFDDLLTLLLIYGISVKNTRTTHTFNIHSGRTKS